MPYQVGRWRAERLHPVMAKNLPLKESFDESLKRLYYDTVIHSKDSLAMLIKLVGSDRVVFGTENPGSGTALNPGDRPQLRRHQGAGRRTSTA